MIGKFIVLVAVVAVASAEPCRHLSTGFSGCGSRVLNFGCNTQVVSATPCYSPVAVPSCVIDPIPTETVIPVNTGVVSSGVYGGHGYGSGVYGSGVYGGYGYGSSVYGSGVYGGYGYRGCGSTVY